MDCNRCKNPGSFEKLKSGHYRKTCEKCRWSQRVIRLSDVDRSARNTVRNELAKKDRQVRPHVHIIYNSRSSDKKSGLVGNDLDRQFVEDLLGYGCTYCGGTVGHMTLDRRDNLVAHTKANVVACCYRCNLLRGSMPYAAWEVLVPAIREARISGLFGDWRSTPISVHKNLTPA